MAWPHSDTGGGGGGGVEWGTPSSLNTDTKVFDSGVGDFEDFAFVVSTKPLLITGIEVTLIGGTDLNPSPSVLFFQGSDYKDDTFTAPAFTSLFPPYDGLVAYWSQDGTIYVRFLEQSFSFEETTQYNLVVTYITLE